MEWHLNVSEMNTDYAAGIDRRECIVRGMQHTYMKIFLDELVVRWLAESTMIIVVVGMHRVFFLVRHKPSGCQLAPGLGYIPGHRIHGLAIVDLRPSLGEQFATSAPPLHPCHDDALLDIGHREDEPTGEGVAGHIPMVVIVADAHALIVLGPVALALR